MATLKRIFSRHGARALARVVGGGVVASVPVVVWWKWARDGREKRLEDYRTRPLLPEALNVNNPDDLLIQDRIQPGDVLLFDRRCETCAAGPHAAAACLAARQFLCDDSSSPGKVRTVDTGLYDHIALVVPGYVKTRADELDPSNLLVLEATASGIVARPIKARFECTNSRAVILLQLCSPGEKREVVGEVEDDEQPLYVQQTRKFVERELAHYRDATIAEGEMRNYRRAHGTVAFFGALAYAAGVPAEVYRGPHSPSAWFVLRGLQEANAATKLEDEETYEIKVEDFLRDSRWQEKDSVRLRPGWKFLAPVVVRTTTSR